MRSVGDVMRAMATAVLIIGLLAPAANADPGQTPEAGRLQAAPSTDLVDGQTITVTDTEQPPVELFGVLQCDSEALVRVDTLFDACDFSTFDAGAVAADGTVTVRITVRRLLSVDNTLVDCAAEAGRCVVFGGPATGAADLDDQTRVVPLHFDEAVSPNRFTVRADVVHVTPWAARLRLTCSESADTELRVVVRPPGESAPQALGALATRCEAGSRLVWVTLRGAKITTPIVDVVARGTARNDRISIRFRRRAEIEQRSGLQPISAESTERFTVTGIRRRVADGELRVWVKVTCNSPTDLEDLGHIEIWQFHNGEERSVVGRFGGECDGATEMPVEFDSGNLRPGRAAYTATLTLEPLTKVDPFGSATRTGRIRLPDGPWALAGP